MIYPESGKVIVVDDQYNEAKPLLDILRKKGIPVLYYSGQLEGFPEMPFKDVRLLFCDLKYNAAHDTKSVLANLKAIIDKLIDQENGAYILLVWSTRETDYIDDLHTMVSGMENAPEFVLTLNKADYFITNAEDRTEIIDRIKERLSELDLDVQDEKSILRAIEESIPENKPEQLSFQKDSIDKIEAKLEEELKKANLFYLFIIWENTIKQSAILTVNTLYKEIPDTIPHEKRLNAMLYYLAYYKLEQALLKADEELKFWAFKDSLNELFSYFYQEEVQKISSSLLKIEELESVVEEIEKISSARFNRWLFINNTTNGSSPGIVYIDSNKTFQFEGYREKSIENEESIIKEIQNYKYIFVDISSECDNAQNKQYNYRVVPGLMIPIDEYDKMRQKELIKNKEPNYISVWKSIEDCGIEWVILFNTNQVHLVSPEKIKSEEKLWSLNRPYVTYLRKMAADNIARQGIGAYGIKRKDINKMIKETKKQ